MTFYRQSDAYEIFDCGNYVVEFRAADPHHAGDGVAIYDLDCLIHFEFPLSALVTSGAGW